MRFQQIRGAIEIQIQIAVTASRQCARSSSRQCLRQFQRDDFRRLRSVRASLEGDRHGEVAERARGRTSTGERRHLVDVEVRRMAAETLSWTCR